MEALLICYLVLLIYCLGIVGLGQGVVKKSEEVPSPKPWPLQFHALLFINSTSSDLQAVDLWYDWPNGRNFNIIQHQLSNVVHDLEWTNGTSFYYDLDHRTCKTIHFSVGILTPDWLHGATYLGVRSIDGFTCNVWSKVDFITYWEDVVTKRPVYWLFYTGMSAHVMTFEEGAVLEDSQWQAPVYCFTDQNQQYSETANSNINRSPKENNPWLRWFQGLEKTAFGGLSLA